MLTWSCFSSRVSTLCTNRFLDVIRWTPASATQCMCLIMTFSKTWCSLRLENQRKNCQKLMLVSVLILEDWKACWYFCDETFNEISSSIVNLQVFQTIFGHSQRNQRMVSISFDQLNTKLKCKNYISFSTRWTTFNTMHSLPMLFSREYWNPKITYFCDENSQNTINHQLLGTSYTICDMN